MDEKQLEAVSAEREVWPLAEKGCRYGKEPQINIVLRVGFTACDEASCRSNTRRGGAAKEA